MEDKEIAIRAGFAAFCPDFASWTWKEPVVLLLAVALERNSSARHKTGRSARCEAWVNYWLYIAPGCETLREEYTARIVNGSEFSDILPYQNSVKPIG